MKRVLYVLLCGALLFAFTACGKTNLPVSDNTEASASVGNSDTGDASDSAGESSDSSGAVYDPDLEHFVIASPSDSPTGSRLQVFDLDRMGEISALEHLEDALVWEWIPSESSNCKYPDLAGAAGMKFRHSAYWDKDVILAGNSNGWVGIIDYETKDLLFEDLVNKGPHCVELMPNGDFVVASSGNGDEDVAGLYYYPLSTGTTEYSDFTKFKGAHGVCYDPQNDCLWSLGDDEVRAYVVKSYGKEDAKLQWLQGEGVSLVELNDVGGHNLTPVYGQPGKYWVTSIKAMYLFDSDAGTLSKSYKNSKDLSYENIKGIAYFPDGTAVQTGYVGENRSPEYASNAFRVITVELTEGKVQRPKAETRTIPYEEIHQVYKVQSLIKDYQ